MVESKATGMEGLETTLPSSWYLDDSIYALEREHIFMQEWICVGREEEIPNQGDHKIIDAYGESILLVRSKTGKLNAFYNVCRHRGSLLCAVEPESNSDVDINDRVELKGGVIGKNRILCPYHGWSYGLDGQLQRAPHMADVANFKPEKIQLYSVLLETWGGFIFINLNPSPGATFGDHIAQTAHNFRRYPLSDLRIAKTIRYEVNANWKVICENYNECYHCGPVHPELCKIVPAFLESGGSELDWEQGVPHRDGSDTFTFSGVSDRPSFPNLNASEQNSHKGDLLYPNLFLSFARDHVAVFILQAKGANRTIIDCLFLFEESEINKDLFNPDDAIEFWHLVNRQDWTICERVQQGMSARIHNHGVFSPMEDWNLDIRKYVIDRIGQLVPVETSS